MEARQREAEDEVHPEPLLEDDTMERYELSESDLRNLGAEDRIYRDDSEAAEHSNVEREVWTVIWVISTNWTLLFSCRFPKTKRN